MLNRLNSYCYEMFSVKSVHANKYLSKHQTSTQIVAFMYWRHINSITVYLHAQMSFLLHI